MQFDDLHGVHSRTGGLSVNKLRITAAEHGAAGRERPR